MIRQLFFSNATSTTEIYTLSLHDALPIWSSLLRPTSLHRPRFVAAANCSITCAARSEEHTSELQSRQYLVCRLLLEKKNKHQEYKVFAWEALEEFAYMSSDIMQRFEPDGI